MTAELAELVRLGLERRGSLLERLESEETDCYRVFHGAVEGRPGLAVDRYGPVLLFQTWGPALSLSEMHGVHGAVEGALGSRLHAVWNVRGGHPRDEAGYVSPELPPAPIGREDGLRVRVDPRHRGQDPLLFLDFRSGRRSVRAAANGRAVLNLFSYTGVAGLAAAAGGASEVWNVDFAESASEWSRRNQELNGLGANVREIREDVLPVVRQLAGLPVKGRGARRRDYLGLEPRAFDLVVLDPPRWSTGPFGAVDVVRDYPSLFKPALLAAKPGGHLLVTNNAAEVAREAWLETLFRTAEKCGRFLGDVTTIRPDQDFPSFDEEPPLKMVWMTAA